ncbi:hypothetical protein F4808DRAFT_361776 [Astrocystis sublimbata]|nr:hypothetical protein F4808DRAFT_361776 [Astrocystis sublimbata]
MPSSTQGTLSRLINFIPGLRRFSHNMPEPKPFKATDVFPNRYADAEVLRRYLIDKGYKDEDIVIQSSNDHGIELQFIRPLTKKERDEISNLFDEEKKKRRKAQSKQTETDD